MIGNSKKRLITLSLSSIIFSPSTTLFANEINEPVGGGIVKDKAESIMTKPPVYDMQIVREDSLTKKIVNSISLSRFSPGFSKEGNKNFERSNMFISTERYGTLNIPHTTSLVRSSKRPKKNSSKDSITSSFPYNRAGKLYIQQTEQSGMGRCSASLIGRGLVISAAHCVFSYGEDPEYKSGDSVFPFKTWFVPAASSTTNTSSLSALSSTGPYGAWQVNGYVFPICYVQGNCSEQVSSAVGANDIVLLRLKKKTDRVGSLPWNAGISYFGYGWNNYGFVKNSYFKNIKSNQITQLGYPGAIGDSLSNLGGSMVRTDALAKDMRREGRVANQWGSMQTPGASGGPVIVNFGKKPTISGVATEGSKHSSNIIVGTTSYGLGSNTTGGWTAHRLGASIFGVNSEFPSSSYTDSTGKNWGGGNIGGLMDYACSIDHLNWKADGYCRSAS